MTDQEKNIAEWSDKILQFLLDKRNENPDLKFWLRRRDTKERLSKGLWFQGTDNYIFVGFSNREGGNLSTRSIGFVVWFDENNNPFSFIELIFRNEKDQKVLDVYHNIMDSIGGFDKVSDVNYKKHYQLKDVFDSFDTFLNKHLPIIHQVISEHKAENQLIQTADDFKTSLQKILQEREKLKRNYNQVNIIIANLTWNSNDWRLVSKDSSNHRWVQDGNVPHESWNFDLDNPRNKAGNILGFCKWTKAPKIEGKNNLIIFHSDGKLVGFYGKVQVIKETVILNERESYNMVADKDLTLVLDHKIENIKTKGYLEDKKRMGQNGFIYINQTKTAINILDEAIELNPAHITKLNALKEWLIEEQLSSIEKQKTEMQSAENKNKMSNIPLNQILYGPPGTGKTYNTINEAIKIVEELSDDELLQKYPKREDLRKVFKAYLEEDEPHIGFCTFHQSFSYEDFVEGIKPLEFKEDDTFLKYDIQDGIFKLMTARADSWDKQVTDIPINNGGFMDLSPEQLSIATFFKMSLGDSTNPDDKEIYDYCVKENKVSIGWGGMIDISNLNTEHEVFSTLKEEGHSEMAARYLNYFKFYIKTGNYVVVSNGNTRIRAIGKVTGKYEFVENSPIRYQHFRSVEWVLKDVDIPVKEFYDKLFQQQTIYKLNSHFIKSKFFKSKEETLKGINQDEVKRNHVLIIDEINRGNISQIFGELITLIEKDKRKGKDEELQVILPYSKRKFYIPANLYIIGTMNTADRSIEALDTALRRRFSFMEMPPQSKLIAKKGITPNMDGIVEGVDLVKLLDTINKRIEKLLDKDHKIGHSYFMTVNSIESLKNAFKDKVIPLLEEYFYGDFGKIGLVLGSSFVEVENGTDNGFFFAKFEGYDSDIADDLKTKKVYKISSSDEWNFESIYDLS